MSEILAVLKVRKSTAHWLILDCGHWYKWTGAQRPPRTGTDLACPSCKLPVVSGSS